MENARRIAVQALQKCENNGYSNLVLNHILETTSLSQRDKGFVSVLVYGTIEKTYLLDFVLQKFITKPLSKLDSPVRAILRSGLYQCLFLDSVPASAAINEAVKLTKQMGKTSASGMVNAVLRKAGAMDINELEFKNETEKMMVLYCVSNAVAKLIMKHYPESYEEILKASCQKPKMTIRVNNLKTTSEELTNILKLLGADVEKSQLENCLYVDFKGDITKTQAFNDGLFHIQGLPSQIAAVALGAKQGNKVIDVCSAPGGKAVTIAQIIQNKGEIYCCDVQQNRLGLIETLVKRNGITVAKTMQWNGAEYNSLFENADAVLCDVPCSGLGIMAKKPDIRFKDLKELDSLIQLQKDILATSAKYLKKGGKLVYSTCTINPCENQQVVDEFLADNRDFCLKDIDLPMIKNKGYVTFLPKESQTDGFFVAYLERL